MEKYNAWTCMNYNTMVVYLHNYYIKRHYSLTYKTRYSNCSIILHIPNLYTIEQLQLLQSSRLVDLLRWITVPSFSVTMHWTGNFEWFLLGAGWKSHHVTLTSYCRKWHYGIVNGRRTSPQARRARQRCHSRKRHVRHCAVPLFSCAEQRKY